jgi:hypothetical protein
VHNTAGNFFCGHIWFWSEQGTGGAMASSISMRYESIAWSLRIVLTGPEQPSSTRCG